MACGCIISVAFIFGQVIALTFASRGRCVSVSRIRLSGSVVIGPRHRHQHYIAASIIDNTLLLSSSLSTPLPTSATIHHHHQQQHLPRLPLFRNYHHHMNTPPFQVLPFRRIMILLTTILSPTFMACQATGSLSERRPLASAAAASQQVAAWG